MLTRLKINAGRVKMKVRDKTFGHIHDHVDGQVWEQVLMPGRARVWLQVKSQVYQALLQESL